jgi:ankyrin repeat protein
MRISVVIIGFFLLVSFMPACRSTEIGDSFPDKKTAALASAAMDSNVKEIDSLLASGAQINGRGKGGITPLMWALYHLKKDGYRALLERHADPNLQEDDGDSVMQWAAQLKDSTYLQLALEHGGNPNLINAQSAHDRSPLFSAIALTPDTTENVALLIKAGADMNLVSPTGTPLTDAAGTNQYEVVYMLLQAGADYKQKDHSGTTVVWAIEHNNIDPQSDGFKWRQKVIDFLREHGVSVNPKDQVAMCSKDLGNGATEIAPCDQKQ